jgi:hypothetical protein
MIIIFWDLTLLHRVNYVRHASTKTEALRRTIANARAHWRYLQAQSRRPAILVVW